MRTSMEDSVQNLQSQLRQHKQSNVQLASDIVQKEEEISTLKSKKDDMLTMHRQEISLKDAEIDQLQNSRDALNEQQNRNRMQLEQIRNLENEQKERNQQIERLEAENERNQSQLSK